MKSSMSLLALGVALAALAAPAAAQQQEPSRWTFTPQVGVYLGGDPGRRPYPLFVSPETVGQPTGVGMARSPMLGLGVERRLNDWFSLRGSAQGAVFSGPTASIHAGTVWCAENCLRSVSVSDRLGMGGVLAAGLDVALRAPRLGSFQPYVFYGLGARAVWFDSRDVPVGFSPSAPSARLTRSGIGARFPIGGVTLDLEFANYDPDFLNPWSFIGGGTQSDKFLSLGLRRTF